MKRPDKILIRSYYMISILLAFAFALSNCNNKENKKLDIQTEATLPIDTLSEQQSELQQPTDSNPTDQKETNITPFINSFLSEVLDKNQRIHQKAYLDKKDVYHLTLFDTTGLKNYYAYSDRRYPKRSQPINYESFIVFIFEYKNQTKALDAFNTIYSYSDLNKQTTDSLRIHNRRLLGSITTSLKPGGLICQKDKYLFSLVKTCRLPPVKMSWENYEALFIKAITPNNSEIKTLSAKCGQMRYDFEKINPRE